MARRVVNKEQEEEQGALSKFAEGAAKVAATGGTLAAASNAPAIARGIYSAGKAAMPYVASAGKMAAKGAMSFGAGLAVDAALNPSEIASDEEMRKKYGDEPFDFSQYRSQPINRNYVIDDPTGRILDETFAPVAPKNPVQVAIENATPRDISSLIVHKDLRQDIDKLIDNSGQASKGITKEVKKFAKQDPDKIERDIVAIQEKKAAGQELGAVDKFIDALTFFLPTALGAAVGGIFEGTEGAVAGGKTAQGLYGSYLDNQRANIDLGLKAEGLKQKSIETAFSGIDKTPGLTDPKTNQIFTTWLKPDGSSGFINVSENRIATKEEAARLVPNSLIAEQGKDRRAEQALSLGWAKISQAEQNRFLNQAKAAQFSDKQTQELGASVNFIRQIKDLGKLQPGGVIKGSFQKVLQDIGFSAGMLSEEVVVDGEKMAMADALRTKGDFLKQEYRKMISGTAVSTQEMEEITRTLPRGDEDEELYKAKVFAAIAKTKKAIRSNLDVIRSTQPLKKATVDSLFKDFEKDLGSDPEEETVNKRIDLLEKAKLKAQGKR